MGRGAGRAAVPPPPKCGAEAVGPQLAALALFAAPRGVDWGRSVLCKETEQQRASGTKEGFADIGRQRCDCADGDTSLQGCDDCLQPTGRIHGCCCACVLLLWGSPKPGRHRAALYPPPRCVGQLCHHGYPHPPSAAVSEHRFMPSITFNAHFLCSFPPKHPTCSHHPPSGSQGAQMKLELAGLKPLQVAKVSLPQSKQGEGSATLTLYRKSTQLLETLYQMSTNAKVVDTKQTKSGEPGGAEREGCECRRCRPRAGGTPPAPGMAHGAAPLPVQPSCAAGLSCRGAARQRGGAASAGARPPPEPHRPRPPRGAVSAGGGGAAAARSPHISAGRSAAARLLEQTARLWAMKGSIEALRVRSAGGAREGGGGGCGGRGRCWKRRLCAGRGHAGDGAAAAGRGRPHQLRRVPLLVLPEGECGAGRHRGASWGRVGVAWGSDPPGPTAAAPPRRRSARSSTA